MGLNYALPALFESCKHKASITIQKEPPPTPFISSLDDAFTVAT